MAKCSAKVRSCPASHFFLSLLTSSQQDHAPCWKPQAQASQSPSEGSLMVLAASSSTRQTPWRLRPGNRKSKRTLAEHQGHKRGGKRGRNCTQVWSGLCSQCQCKLCSGQTAVLAPAVNAQEQGLLFCPFAKHFNTCTPGALARWRATRQWQARETAYHTAALLMFRDEQQRELQSGLSFHLPVSPLDRVSRLLLIRLYSSPSPLLNSIMPSLNLCM